MFEKFRKSKAPDADDPAHATRRFRHGHVPTKPHEPTFHEKLAAQKAAMAAGHADGPAPITPDDIAKAEKAKALAKASAEFQARIQKIGQSIVEAADKADIWPDAVAASGPGKGENKTGWVLDATVESSLADDKLRNAVKAQNEDLAKRNMPIITHASGLILEATGHVVQTAPLFAESEMLYTNNRKQIDFVGSQTDRDPNWIRSEADYQRAEQLLIEFAIYNSLDIPSKK